MQEIYKIPSTLQPVLCKDEPFFNYAGPVGHSWPNDPFAQGAYSCVGAGEEELWEGQLRRLLNPQREQLDFLRNIYYLGKEKRGRAFRIKS